MEHTYFTTFENHGDFLITPRMSVFRYVLSKVQNKGRENTENMSENKSRELKNY